MTAPEPRLVTQLWVQAQVRLCDLYVIQMVVARRGDPDAGAVLVRLVRGAGRNLVLSRHTQIDGTSGWTAAAGGEALDDAAAEDFIAREVGRDPDLWVLDVDDPEDRYWPDRPIEA